MCHVQLSSRRLLTLSAIEMLHDPRNKAMDRFLVKIEHYLDRSPLEADVPAPGFLHPLLAYVSICEYPTVLSGFRAGYTIRVSIITQF